jgi:tripartite ATP-independent transporter DctM subunit
MQRATQPQSGASIAGQLHDSNAAASDAGAWGGLRALVRANQVIVVAVLLLEFCVVLGNIIVRLYLHHSFLWTDEVARMALSTLAFLGGALAYQRRDHASVRVLINLFPKGVQAVMLAGADVLVLLVSALVGCASIEFFAANANERTPVLQLPAGLIGLPLPLGMALLVVYAGAHLWRDHRWLGLKVFASIIVLAIAGELTSSWWLPLMDGDGAIVAALTIFLVAIFAGLPVGFVLLLATAAYTWFSGAPSLVVLPQSMVSGTGNFILLAIPFFILAGLVMERGGISARLIRFISVLVGHLRGGLLQVSVVSMYVISGLSGSKPADVAAVGTVMRDELRERHGAPEGAAVLAAAAIMGETVPPSIAMLIVGSITNISVAALFVGGMIPAAVMALVLMLLIYWRARRSKTVPLPRAPRELVLRSALGAVLPLLLPGILLGGILFGIATPTEVSAFAVVYGLVLAVLFYRSMSAAAFWSALVDTAALTGVLLFIFAASSGFSWALTIAYLPQRLVEMLQSMGNSTTIFMLGSIVLLIVVGVLLEGLPSLNVLAPLLVPIAAKLGLSELHYALVLIIAMGVGGFMPLAGVGFYVCCAIMRCNIEAASRAMLPYLAVILIGLLLVAFVPGFALTLPHYLGFHG